MKNTSEAHKGKIGGKFLGDTKGNADLGTDKSYMSMGGSGEAHKPKTADKFCGPTKGNSDLPPNRTSDTPGGYGGGQHKAGGSSKKMAY